MDFNKIDPSGRFKARQQFLLENLAYYDHWSADWIYNIPKDSLTRELKRCLYVYGSLRTDEFERYLLLGEIAHYLYNLDQRAYYDTAEMYYKEAIGLNGKDCRGYWFLGYAYVTSDEIEKGVAAFRQALQLADDRTGIDFWQEYAFAMYVGFMPFHCRYGLDQYKRRGGSSLLWKVMDSTLRAKCLAADPDITYRSSALWQAERKGSQIQLLSYPLGIRISIDSNWQLQLGGFGKRMAAFGIQPPALASASGKRIGYSIGMVVKVAENGERLEDFMASLMQRTPGMRDASFPFRNVFPNGISYSFNSDSLYADRGGARLRFVGIERPVPAYPGLALEEDQLPVKLKEEAGKLNFFTMGVMRTRFPDRIFYFFLLDSCEDIREESWNGFQQFLTRQVVLD
ncbi:MAG TPA: hypothetical protein VMH27_15090 [Puia sp.]|nr:hypothetical protein [Puia sp.]